MRTLRLALVGTVTLALLGGLGGAVVAQDEAETGSATYISGSWTWTEDTDDGAIHEVKMSDPRASGTLTFTDISWQEYVDTTPPLSSPAAVASVAGMELVNDQGSWSGVSSAVYDPAMGWQFVGWSAGGGAYEGLTLFVHGTRKYYSASRMPLEGIIFEGPAPMMVEAVQVPAE